MLTLENLRASIDEIDGALINLLEKRMDVSAAIAEYKREHDLPILDASRESEKLAAVRAHARPETGEHLAEIYRAILGASRAYQAQHMGSRRDG